MIEQHVLPGVEIIEAEVEAVVASPLRRLARAVSSGADKSVFGGRRHKYRESEWIRDRFGRWMKYIGMPWVDLWSRDEATGQETPNFSYGTVLKSSLLGDRILPGESKTSPYFARIASPKLSDGSYLIEVADDVKKLGRTDVPPEGSWDDIGPALPVEVPQGSAFIRRKVGTGQTFVMVTKGRAKLSRVERDRRASLGGGRARLGEPAADGTVDIDAVNSEEVEGFVPDVESGIERMTGPGATADTVGPLALASPEVRLELAERAFSDEMFQEWLDAVEEASGRPWVPGDEGTAASMYEDYIFDEMTASIDDGLRERGVDPADASREDVDAVASSYMEQMLPGLAEAFDVFDDTPEDLDAMDAMGPAGGAAPREPRLYTPSYPTIQGGALESLVGPDGTVDMAELREFLKGRDLVGLDFETTGLSVTGRWPRGDEGDGSLDRPTQVALVPFRDGQPVDDPAGRMVSMMNPYKPIPPIVTRLTGIDDAQVQGQRSWADALPDIIRTIGDKILVAQNASFDVEAIRDMIDTVQNPDRVAELPPGTDVDRLRRELDELGATSRDWLPPGGVIDTKPMAGHVFGKQRDRAPGEPVNDRLVTLSEHFGIPHENAHDALSDIEATIGVLGGLLDVGASRGSSFNRDEQVRRFEEGDATWPQQLERFREQMAQYRRDRAAWEDQQRAAEPAGGARGPVADLDAMDAGSGGADDALASVNDALLGKLSSVPDVIDQIRIQELVYDLDVLMMAGDPAENLTYASEVLQEALKDVSSDEARSIIAGVMAGLKGGNSSVQPGAVGAVERSARLVSAMDMLENADQSIPGFASGDLELIGSLLDEMTYLVPGAEGPDAEELLQEALRTVEAPESRALLSEVLGVLQGGKRPKIKPLSDGERFELEAMLADESEALDGLVRQIRRTANAGTGGEAELPAGAGTRKALVDRLAADGASRETLRRVATAWSIDNAVDAIMDDPNIDPSWFEDDTHVPWESGLPPAAVADEVPLPWEDGGTLKDSGVRLARAFGQRIREVSAASRDVDGLIEALNALALRVPDGGVVDLAPLGLNLQYRYPNVDASGNPLDDDDYRIKAQEWLVAVQDDLLDISGVLSYVRSDYRSAADSLLYYSDRDLYDQLMARSGRGSSVDYSSGRTKVLTENLDDIRDNHKEIAAAVSSLVGRSAGRTIAPGEGLLTDAGRERFSSFFDEIVVGGPDQDDGPTFDLDDSLMDYDSIDGLLDLFNRFNGIRYGEPGSEGEYLEMARGMLVERVMAGLDWVAGEIGELEHRQAAHKNLLHRAIAERLGVSSADLDVVVARENPTVADLDAFRRRPVPPEDDLDAMDADRLPPGGMNARRRNARRKVAEIVDLGDFDLPPGKNSGPGVEDRATIEKFEADYKDILKRRIVEEANMEAEDFGRDILDLLRGSAAILKSKNKTYLSGIPKGQTQSRLKIIEDFLGGGGFLYKKFSNLSATEKKEAEKIMNMVSNFVNELRDDAESFRPNDNDVYNGALGAEVSTRIADLFDAFMTQKDIDSNKEGDTDKRQFIQAKYFESVKNGRPYESRRRLAKRMRQIMDAENVRPRNSYRYGQDHAKTMAQLPPNARIPIMYGTPEIRAMINKIYKDLEVDPKGHRYGPIAARLVGRMNNNNFISDFNKLLTDLSELSRMINVQAQRGTFDVAPSIDEKIQLVMSRMSYLAGANPGKENMSDDFKQGQADLFKSMEQLYEVYNIARGRRLKDKANWPTDWNVPNQTLLIAAAMLQPYSGKASMSARNHQNAALALRDAAERPSSTNPGARFAAINRARYLLEKTMAKEAYKVMVMLNLAVLAPSSLESMGNPQRITADRNLGPKRGTPRGLRSWTPRDLAVIDLIIQDLESKIGGRTDAAARARQLAISRLQMAKRAYTQGDYGAFEAIIEMAMSRLSQFGEMNNLTALFDTRERVWGTRQSQFAQEFANMKKQWEQTARTGDITAFPKSESVYSRYRGSQEGIIDQDEQYYHNAMALIAAAQKLTAGSMEQRIKLASALWNLNQVDEDKIQNLNLVPRQVKVNGVTTTIWRGMDPDQLNEIRNMLLPWDPNADVRQPIPVNRQNLGIVWGVSDQRIAGAILAAKQIVESPVAEMPREEIAAALKTTAGNVDRLLQPLVSNGLLEIEIDKNGRRIYHVGSQALVNARIGKRLPTNIELKVKILELFRRSGGGLSAAVVPVSWHSPDSRVQLIEGAKGEPYSEWGIVGSSGLPDPRVSARWDPVEELWVLKISPAGGFRTFGEPVGNDGLVTRRYESFPELDYDLKALAGLNRVPFPRPAGPTAEPVR